MAVRMRNKRTGTTGTFSHPDVLSDEWVPVEAGKAETEKPKTSKAPAKK